MEHELEIGPNGGGGGGAVGCQRRLQICDNCREVIIQLKFKGLSRRHPVERQEKEPFQDKEQNVQRLVVTKNVPQIHMGVCRDEPRKAGKDTQ